MSYAPRLSQQCLRSLERYFQPDYKGGRSGNQKNSRETNSGLDTAPTAKTELNVSY